MAKTEALSVWDVAESSSRFSTKQELERLKLETKKLSAIGKGTDNINFEEQKTKEKEKYRSFDNYLDDIFDSYLLVHRDEILPIVNNTSLTPQQKTAQIQSAFKNFLIPNLSGYADNETVADQELQKKINIFNDQINKLKETEEYKVIGDTKTLLTTLSTQIQLNQIKEVALAPVDYSIIENDNTTSSHMNNPMYGDTKYSNRKEYSMNEEDDIDQKSDGGIFSLFGKKKKKKGEKKEETADEDLKSVGRFERGKYKQNEDYVDAFDPNENLGYLEKNKFPSENKIENIYKKGHSKRVMERIFDNDEQEELRKRHFGVNLSAENGLANIVLQFQKHFDAAGVALEESDTVGDILTGIEGEQEKEEYVYENGLSAKTLKQLLKKRKIDYQRENGILGMDGMFDYVKMSKILNRASWKDLVTFAQIMQTRKNPDRVLKEWFNAKETADAIDSDQVFTYLCDINGDADIGTSKNNKEQKNVGDVGTISGQQLLFTINQAIKTQSALLGGEKEGEAVVVQNIVRMIATMDRRDNFADENENDNVGKGLKTALTDFHTKSFCTKENLTALLSSYPESKVLFISAMEKIAGSANANQTDLYDILTGQDLKNMEKVDSFAEQTLLRKKIENTLRAKPELASLIQEEGIVELRENLMTKIMTMLDGVEIFFNDNNLDIPTSSITKEFHRKQAIKKLTSVLDIVSVGIGSDGKSVNLNLGFGKSGKSPDGTKIWSIKAGPTFYIGKQFEVGVSVSGSYGVEYNKQQVISASLDDVRNAKYLGVEGGAGAKVGKGHYGLYAALGVFHEKDPVEGIKQLESAYINRSNVIFSIDNLQDFSPEGVQALLEARINKAATNEYVDFIRNNKNQLRNDVRFIVDYLRNTNVFDYLKQNKSETQQREALQSLLRILQDGNVQQRKSDIIMNLHGKLDITRLSAGLTTTWLFSGGNSGAEANKDVNPGTGNTGDGATTDDGTIDTGTTGNDGGTTVSGTSGETGGQKIGFWGVYVGARISTWKNKYLPNANQLLMTEYEIAKGSTDIVDIDAKDITKYAAYLQGLFNKEGLDVKATSDNKIEITYQAGSDAFFDGDGEGLLKLLNIHSTTAAKEQFWLKGNKLIIGNVGPISAYTVALNNGVDRILCLGTKNLDDAVRLQSNNIVTESTLKGIEPVKDGYKAFTKEKLDAVVAGLDTKLSVSEKKMFSDLFDAEGKLVTQPQNIVYEAPVKAGDKFTTGTLTLSKKLDGTYKLKKEVAPLDKLVLTYQKESSNVNRVSLPGMKKEFNEVTASIEPNIDQYIFDLFNPTDKYNQLLNDMKNIEKIGNTGKGKLKPEFVNFMQNALNLDYKAAIGNLKDIMKGSQHGEFDNVFDDVLKDGNNKRRIYIVGKFEAIFAHEGRYADLPTNSPSLHGKSEAFLNITGPKIETIRGSLRDELLTIKKDLAQSKDSDGNIRKFGNVEKEKSTNIFGYSAFYRSGVKAHHYGITTLGDTMICKDYVAPIEKNAADAKEWIIKNLKANASHAENLVASIKKQFPKEYQDAISVPTLITLLSKGELTEEDLFKSGISKNTLDISDKKIILNSDAVFYFMGECFNESLGIRINSIDIQSNYTTEAYSNEGKPEDRYLSNLFARSHSIAGTPITERKDFSLKAHHGEKFKEKSKPTTKDLKPDPGKGETDDSDSQNPNPGEEKPDGGATEDDTPIDTGDGGDGG